MLINNNKIYQLSKLVLHIVFTLITSLSFAQENLVPNSSFEEYNWCPNSTDGFYIDACKYWTSPTLGGSPDYFNACSTEYDTFLQTYMYSVPQNYYGNQIAHSGNAYAGVVFGQNAVGQETYSEYIQIKLNTRLESGKFYEVKFYIHNPRTNTCINSIGALFTPNEISINTEEVLDLTPQVYSNPNVFFCDTNIWYEVKQSFFAHGNEEYLTIGVFKQTPDLLATDYQGTPVLEFFSTYLYVDDVSVIESNYEMTNVFSPNGDGINDFYSLNLTELGAKKAVIYNRWGNTILKGETSINWDGTSNGNECSEGVYYIHIEFENNSLNGFVHLVK